MNWPRERLNELSHSIYTLQLFLVLRFVKISADILRLNLVNIFCSPLLNRIFSYVCYLIV
jgi:hypothetical protein